MVKSSVVKSSSAGVTLIGVLFATVIFTTILIATMNLMGRTMREVGRSREDFIATNLAREGLELVQFVRDTNWFTPAPSWTDNSIGSEPLCSGTADSELTIDSDNTGLVRVRQLTNLNDALLYLNPDVIRDIERFEHTPVVGQTPIYSRFISINCADQSAPNNEKIVVTSRVTWVSRGQSHEVTLRTDLFNWRQ